ncbi:MAG: hypothetical protein AAGF55_17455 [Pseudomonadota bacterium]
MDGKLSAVQRHQTLPPQLHHLAVNVDDAQAQRVRHNRLRDGKIDHFCSRYAQALALVNIQQKTAKPFVSRHPTQPQNLIIRLGKLQHQGMSQTFSNCWSTRRKSLNLVQFELGHFACGHSNHVTCRNLRAVYLQTSSVSRQRKVQDLPPIAIKLNRAHCPAFAKQFQVRNMFTIAHDMPVSANKSVQDLQISQSIPIIIVQALHARSQQLYFSSIAATQSISKLFRHVYSVPVHYENAAKAQKVQIILQISQTNR